MRVLVHIVDALFFAVRISVRSNLPGRPPTSCSSSSSSLQSSSQLHKLYRTPTMPSRHLRGLLCLAQASRRLCPGGANVHETSIAIHVSSYSFDHGDYTSAKPAHLRLMPRGLIAVRSPAVTAIQAISQDHKASMSCHKIFRTVVSLLLGPPERRAT